MTSYMTTMFQIARSIFQSKPVEPNAVKEVSAPVEIISALVSTQNDVVKEVTVVPVVSTQNDVVKEVAVVPVVPTQNDVVKEVAVVPVVSTQNDVVKEVAVVPVVPTQNDVVKEVAVVPVVPTQNDVVKEVSVPEPEPIVVPENTQSKSVESVPKRKPRGKTIKK